MLYFDVFVISSLLFASNVCPVFIEFISPQLLLIPSNNAIIFEFNTICSIGFSVFIALGSNILVSNIFAMSSSSNVNFVSFENVSSSYPAFPYYVSGVLYETYLYGWGILDGYEFWKYFKSNY
ncbi:MAG: hypothetical protein KGD64_12030 [Candidatus Heimdallarchaeota archaeon]|nr:hypothetical protein [Candidatus Heimdallarchaeota archaeon]